MKIDDLGPIVDGVLVAEAYVVRSSRRRAYAEVDPWAHGELAGRATTYVHDPRCAPAGVGSIRAMSAPPRTGASPSHTIVPTRAVAGDVARG
ncbi:hypothetical protein K2Z84_00855 [Candidatus Binatia bacterium]|nr:hypothetical protein [Candidatus Binatia bacterium]